MLRRRFDFGLGEHGVTSTAPSRRARFIVLSDDVAPASNRDRERVRSARLFWRVVAANNRPLGRSASSFGDFSECVAAATQLHERVGDLRSTVAFDRATVTWNWTASIDAEPVARNVRAYVRRIECTRALRQFMSVVRGAPPEIDEIRYTGLLVR
jgi:hypothetical protein